ncbi:MAG: hypothetical protein ABF289_06380 [Clostridiales bacterium]
MKGGRLAPQTDTTHYYFGVIKDNELKERIATLKCIFEVFIKSK